MSEEIKYFAHLKTKTNCLKCSNTVFINGPTYQLFCSKCMTDFEIDKERIISYVQDCYDRVETYPMPEKGGISYLDGTSTFHIAFGNNPPKCEQCETNIPLEKLKENQTKENWKITCETCGNKINIEQIPEWIREKVPEAKIAIGTEFEDLNENNSSEIEGVVLSCPKCSGSLEIDGSERLIKCDYCESNVYIPDDLWFRLHPVKQIKEWYIGFSGLKKAIIEEAEINKGGIVTNRDELLQTKVTDYDISVRALNSLKNANINTIAELIAQSKESLKNLPNMGGKAFSEIVETVEELGLQFAD